ncbi:MAG: hypothetical protein MUF30_10600, partial [Burkholderiales bacterium]|nr:hypothetical protein [Burkholderiales bacterium]
MRIDADDTSRIESGAGAIAISFSAGGAAAGAGLASNIVTNRVTAAIEGGAASSTVGGVTVDAASDALIRTLAIAGAGADTFALGGAITFNQITNRVDAHVSGGGRATGAGNVVLNADDTSEIEVAAGGFAGSSSASVGASLSTNRITNTVTAYADNGTLTSSAGGVTLDADNAAAVTAFTVGGSGAAGFALGGAISVNDLRNDVTVAARGGSTLRGATGVALTARDRSDIQSLSGAVAFSATASVGAAVATNLVENEVTADIGTASLTATAGHVTVDATNDSHTKTAAMGGTVSSGAAISGAFAVNRITNTTAATAASGAVMTATAGDVALRAADDSLIQSLGGQASVTISSGNGGLAIGAAGTYNEIGNVTRAQSSGATLAAGRHALVTADNDSTIETIAAGASVAIDVTGAGGFALAGSIAVNVIDNVTEALVDGGSVTADGTIAIVADGSATTKTFAGALGVGTAAGVGASLAVSTIGNTTHAGATNATLTGRGNTALALLRPDGGVGTLDTRGVAVFARTHDDLDLISANVGVGVVGAAGTIAMTFVDDDTRATISGGTVNGSLAGAHADQAVRVGAVSTTDIDTRAGTFAAGLASAGVGSDTAIVTNTTTARIDGGADVKARGTVAVTTDSRTAIDSIVVSGSVGLGAGVAGSVIVAKVANTNEAAIVGATVRSDGDLRVTADDTVELGKPDSAGDPGMLAGGVAIGGAAGIGASVVVTQVDNDTTARITNSTTDARNTTQVAATSATDIGNYVATGGLAGFLGAAGSIAVNTVTNTTQALIDERDGGTTRVNTTAGVGSTAQDVSVDATQTTAVRTTAGAASIAGVAAAGAAVNVNTVRNTTSAAIGAGSQVDAQRDIAVRSTATQTVDASTIAAGGALGLSVQGALAMANVGAAASGDQTTAARGTGSTVDGIVGISAVGNQLKTRAGGPASLNDGNAVGGTATTRADAARVGLSVGDSFATTGVPA